ncbi:MAG TPA: hypothetical protein VMA53_27585 [Stellaceae bacterium]|nr:hypothetical protein [Stellaceae bacterium]
MQSGLAVALSCGLTLLMLAGCAASQAPRPEDEAACTSRGFQVGTPQFAACLEREELAHRCAAGATLALHVKPHPELLPCPSDPA